jgi:excisionase family DNA binding protein
MTEPVLIERRVAARRLHVSLRTIRRWGRLGRIENVRVGPRLVMVTEESVEQLVRDGRDRKDAAA